MSDKVKFGGDMIEAKMLVFARPDPEEKSGFKLLLIEPDFKWWMKSEDVRIDTVSVRYRAPDNMSHEEFIRKAIESLRDKQKQVQAEAALKMAKLDEQIKSLLLLTYQPDDSVVVEAVNA